MPAEWRNWSGSLRFTPGKIEQPGDEEALAAIIRQALERGHHVRMVGAGHSSSPLVETNDVLVSLDHFSGIESFDGDTHQATVRTGMTVHEAGEALFDAGLALHNTGDVDVQTLVGAISTGTHGSGRSLQNLSAALVGVRLVDGQGRIVECDETTDPDFMRAARVALGTLGAYTAVRLQLLPAYKLHRGEWCTTIDKCLDHLDELIEQNRNFDFYWYPRSDEVNLRLLNFLGQQTDELPYARQVMDKVERSHRVLPRERELKFDEMEFAVPSEAGRECFLAVRERIKERHRQYVGWRVLYRTVAPDQNYLSPATGRDTVTISLHQNNTLPFREFFKDMEPIFRAHGGRPHWGKKHFMDAADLAPLYPEWDDFLDVRRRMDPHGVFLTPYMHRLLVGAEHTGGAS